LSPLIQVPDYALRLQRRLGLANPPDSVLGPETVGVIVLDDLTQEGTTRRCRGAIVQAGVVAEAPMIALTHATPAGTIRGYRMNVVAVTIGIDGTANVSVSITGAAIAGLTLTGDTSFTDLVRSGRPASQLGSLTDAAPPTVAVTNIYQLRLDNNITQRFPLNVFMGDGVFQNSIVVTSTTTNTPLRVSFEWTEE